MYFRSNTTADPSQTVYLNVKPDNNRRTGRGERIADDLFNNIVNRFDTETSACSGASYEIATRAEDNLINESDPRESASQQHERQQEHAQPRPSASDPTEHNSSAGQKSYSNKYSLKSATPGTSTVKFYAHTEGRSDGCGVASYRRWATQIASCKSGR